MDIDSPAPINAMAAMMAASKKGKGKELSQAEVDAKDKKDKEGLPWYVSDFHFRFCLAAAIVHD